MALKKASRQSKDAGTVNVPIDDLQPDQNRTVLLIALLVLLASMLLTFLWPRNTSDTFMILAGGRDVLDGKLTKPDDWSFNSEGRVWINQSWGTGVLYYALWKQVGYVGIVIVKGVTIGLIALFVVLAARQLRASYSLAMIVAAYILGAGTNFIDMRPNAVGLALAAALLWILYRSYGHPHRIWIAVALLTIWAHMHGSFIFGIAMLGWWTATNYSVMRWQGHSFDQLKQLWTLPIATVLALGLSCATSPFGITNLIQPFTMMGLFVEEPWPLPANEMAPLFSDETHAKVFAGTPWYLFMLGCLAIPFVRRMTNRRDELDGRLEDNTGHLVKWIFSLGLALITVVMAFKARRFMEISLVVCAPFVASELQRLFSHKRLAWVTGLSIVGAASLAGLLQLVLPHLAASPPNQNGVVQPFDKRFVWVVAAMALPLLSILDAFIVAIGRRRRTVRLETRPMPTARIAWLTDQQKLAWAPLMVAAPLAVVLMILSQGVIAYHRTNPLTRDNDIFSRLVYLHEFPSEAVEFLVVNDIEGNIINERTWAGYLHWNHPKLKVMFGGRSRQVYSPRAARLAIDLGDAKNESLHRKLDISLAGFPLDNTKIPTSLAADPDSPWRIIYFDLRSVIAANWDIPTSRQFILDADAGKLVYPSVKSEKYSLAARRLAFNSKSSPSEILESTVAAASEQPSWQLYQLLTNQIRRQGNGISISAIVSFFEAELVRLHGRDIDQTSWLVELNSRELMAQTLANVYTRSTPPQPARSEFWNKYARQIGSAIKSASFEARNAYISEIPDEFVSKDEQER